jgi:hypothetical protein
MPGTQAIAPFWRRDGGAVGYTLLGEHASRSELVFTRPDGTGTESIKEEQLYLRAGPDALSPDGRRLVYFAISYPTQTARLRTWEFAGKVENSLGDEAALNLAEGYHLAPTAAWSPEGRWLLVSRPTEKGWGLLRLSPEGAVQARLTPEGVECRGGSWTGAG